MTKVWSSIYILLLVLTCVLYNLVSTIVSHSQVSALLCLDTERVPKIYIEFLPNNESVRRPQHAYHRLHSARVHVRVVTSNAAAHATKPLERTSAARHSP